MIYNNLHCSSLAICGIVRESIWGQSCYRGGGCNDDGGGDEEEDGDDDVDDGCW
jgi:hypothetical protein